MAAWTEGDVPVGGTNIHYYRMGERGKPPVVLLHGFTDMGLVWMRLATDLAPDYDLIMIDAIGHGQSGGPEHGFRERAAGDVLAVIDALGIDRPALVGHSMGGATAAGVAAEASDRLRGIALEDPPWRDEPPTPMAENSATPGTGSRAALGGPEWAEWNRAFKTLSPEARRAQAAKERPEWPEIDTMYWADAKAQLNLDVVKERNAAPPALARHRAPDHLPGAAHHRRPGARRHRHPRRGRRSVAPLAHGPRRPYPRRGPQHPPRAVRALPRRRHRILGGNRVNRRGAEGTRRGK